MTNQPPLLPVSEAAANFAAELNEYYGEIGYAEKIRRREADGDHDPQLFARFEAALQSPPAVSQDGAGMREALERIAERDAEPNWTNIDNLEEHWERRNLWRRGEAMKALTHQGELQRGSEGERAGRLSDTLEDIQTELENIRGYTYEDGTDSLIRKAVFNIVEMLRRAVALSTPPSDNGQGLREALGWQPIETAPMDGSRVDVLFPSGRLADAFWTGKGWGRKERRGMRSNVHEVTIVRQGEDATHWMPLPAPPAAISGSNDRKGDGEQ